MGAAKATLTASAAAVSEILAFMVVSDVGSNRSKRRSLIDRDKADTGRNAQGFRAAVKKAPNRSQIALTRQSGGAVMFCARPTGCGENGNDLDLFDLASEWRRGRPRRFSAFGRRARLPLG